MKARPIAQLEAAVLTVYGFVLTSVGLLVQAGMIDRSARSDQKALAWHAFPWDPWFLIWGLLTVAALRLDHNARPRQPVMRSSGRKRKRRQEVCRRAVRG